MPDVYERSALGSILNVTRRVREWVLLVRKRDLCLKREAIDFSERHDDAGTVHKGKKYVTKLDQSVLVELANREVDVEVTVQKIKRSAVRCLETRLKTGSHFCKILVYV